jgi:6-phospho-beta-glucosidase
VILTILGGSAHSTPVLVDCLARSYCSERRVVRLVGRDPGRLAAVTRACCFLTNGTLTQVEPYSWGDWMGALPGSDVVLVQIRQGDYSGRTFDETFPLERGVPGDEGLGPGGLSAAWRSWPVLRNLLTGIRAKAPAAECVLLTSPGSLLVRLAATELRDTRVTGVCELPWTTLCTICGSAENAMKSTFDYQGVNHIGWLYNVRLNGRDMLHQHGGTAHFPNAGLIRQLGAYPLKYLRMHYRTEAVVAEQRRAPAARVQQLKSIALQAFDAYSGGTESDIRDAMKRRRAEWYPDAVVPLLHAFEGKAAPVPLFLTRGSDGGVVQEQHYSAVRGQLVVQQRSQRPPAQVSETLEQFIRYEDAAAMAVVHRCKEEAAEALSMHPWVESRKDAEWLAQCIVNHAALAETERTYASA